MNKVTLSVAALAAIGGTVQVQAAELSGDDLKAANEKHYADISAIIAEAISQVEKNCSDVKETYTLELSTLQKAAETILNENKVELKVDEYQGKVVTILAAANSAQAFFTVDESYKTLTKLLSDQKTEAAKFSLAGPSRLALLNAVDFTEIDNAIAAAKADNVATEDEVKDITAKIKAKTDDINDIMSDIVTAEETRATNNTDYNEVVAKVNEAVTLYQAEVQTVIANLPGDPAVYGDWQKEALKKLTEAYNSILAAKDDNEAAHAEALAEDATKNSTGKKKANLDAITEACKLFADAEENGGIYNNDYKTKKENQEAWNKAATDNVTGTAKLSSDLTTLKNDLGENCVSSKDGDIEAIRTKINTLNEDIKAKYKAHALTDGMFDERIEGIDTEITNLRKASAALITNYQNWSTMRSEVFTGETSLQATYNAAKTNAEKVTSVEGVDLTYTANAHMTDQNTAITTALNKLNTNIVEKYAESVKATEYYGGNYSTDKSDASTKIDNYKSWTVAAQASFTTAATTIKNAEAALAGLTKVVGDNTSVTTDGKWNGTTYGQAIQNLKDEIKAIRDAIAAANEKQGEEHKTLMATAASKTFTSVEDITKKFDENKTAYEKDVKVNAADKVVAQANALVKGYTTQLTNAAAKLTDKDVHYSTVNGEIEDLKSKVSDANSKIPEGWSGLDYDIRLEKAPSVIAELSVVNTTLEGLKTKVDAAVKKAETAAKNYANWTSLNAKVTDDSSDKSISNKIAEVKEAVKAYDAASHWNTILNGYDGDLTTIGNNIEDSYKSADMELSVDATVSGYETQLTNLFDNVAKVATDASNNETAKSAATTGLDTKLSDLQKKWQEVYDYITTTDKSSTVDTWLDKMAAQQKAVTDMGTTVNTEYMAGNAYTKYTSLTESINAIATAIDGIKIAHVDQYPDAVKADNEKQHLDLFLNGAYAKAEDAFTKAVAKLNQFAAIQNSAIQVAIEKLAQTHAEIYANAPKLRELKTKEGEAYSPYDVEGNTVIYSAGKYINEANDIKDAIESKLDEYVNAVNLEALNAYKEDIKAAKTEIDVAMLTVDKYNKETLPQELTKLDSDITAAANNVAVDSKGYPTDKDFAINLDKWTASIDNVTEALPAALDKAAQNEYDFRLSAAKAQYEKDKNDINALTGINKKTFLDQLENEYEASVIAAEEEYESLTAEGGAGVDVKTITTALDNIAKYYDGTTGRSKAYNDAKDKSDNNEAYKTLESTYAPVAYEAVYELRKSALDLFTMHKDNSSAAAAVNELYTLIDDKLDDAGNDADLADNLDDYASSLNPKNRESALSMKIVEVQGRIIAAEKTDLNAQIELLKEQYNKAIKAGQKIEDMKNYEELISKYSTDLTNMDPKLTFDDAKTALLEFEAKIADTYQTLTKMSDAEAYNKAVAEIDGIIATTVEQLQSVADMVGEFSQLVTEFGVELDELNDAFDALKADYAVKAEAGTVLFYKDNLISDIKEFQPEIEEFATGDLKDRYDRLVENKSVYDQLLGEDGELAKYTKRFEDIKAITATYTHINQTIEPRGYIETQNEWTQRALDNTKDEIITKYNDETLKNSDVEYYTGVWDTNNESYLKQATFYEASGMIATANDLFEDITIDATKYGTNTLADLLEQQSDLEDTLDNVYNFNIDAQDGLIFVDIDGNDVRVLPEGGTVKQPIECDYMTEAWPAIQERVKAILSELAAFEDNVENKQFMLGDANHDGEVNVIDYQTVRNWILLAKNFNDLEEEKAYGGDFNGDKKFDVADLTCISNTIFNPDFTLSRAAAISARARSVVATEDKLTIANESEETTIFGKTVRIALNIDHAEAFTAGQMDIKLPQGMKLAGQSLSDRANGHELLANELSNGTFRLVASTVENNEFNGRSGALIYLDVEVGSDYNGGSISVDNVIFSDANANTYNLTQNGPIVPTGIDGIEAASVKERIYSVGGQMMKAVKKGINIIVGENNKTQKVVK